MGVSYFEVKGQRRNGLPQGTANSRKELKICQRAALLWRDSSKVVVSLRNSEDFKVESIMEESSINDRASSPIEIETMSM